ncbi:MAG: TetR-like C-terminal domain-containing protein [Chloroflexota bacterium]
MTRRAGLDPQMVVQAAAEIIDREGQAALTLAALAAHFKVAVPSLYNHVGGMPGLQQQLALLGRRQLTQQLGRAVMGKSGDDAIMAMADAYRAYVKTHPGLYASTLHVADASDTESRAAEDEAVEIALKVLAYYDLRDEMALHMVRGFRSLVHGFASLEVAGGFGIPLDLDESFRLLIQGYIQMLSAQMHHA